MKTKQELVKLGLDGVKVDEIMILQEKMLEEAVKFQFRKKSGEVRDAVGTLNRALMKLPDGKLWEPVPKPEGAKPRAVPENTIGYFDLEKGMWRSFIATEFIGLVAA